MESKITRVALSAAYWKRIAATSKRTGLPQAQIIGRAVEAFDLSTITKPEPAAKPAAKKPAAKKPAAAKKKTTTKKPAAKPAAAEPVAS